MYSQNGSCFVHNKTSKIDPKLRLFCFHHAGGAASFFRDWHQILPSEAELIAIQLPGRETRNSQPFVTDINVIVKQITDNFYKYQAIPFMFFGHSLGGLIAFEVAHELQRYHLKPPKYLIISGRNAPQIPSKEKILHHLPDELFIKGLMKYQGMPDEVLQHKELLEVLLPRLRADFTLSETYQYKKRPPLTCPILVLGGSNDTTVNHDELAAWKTHTIKKCSVNLFPGGHFFLSSYKKEVWDSISLAIKEALDPSQTLI